jgi:DNA-directed RNA polymerase subunit H (RpoH/RPB5)
MSQDLNEILSLLKAMLKMVGIRGYDINNYRKVDTLKVSEVEQYLTNEKNNNILQYIKNVYEPGKIQLRIHLSRLFNYPNSNKKLFVYFTNRFPNVHTRDINEFHNLYRIIKEKLNITNLDAIMIGGSHLTGKEKDRFNEFVELHQNNIQYFTDEEIYFNPTEHIYSSDARLLSLEERTKLLENNRFKVSQMPATFTNDPLTKYLGANPNDIIEYIRDTFAYAKQSNAPEMLVEKEIFYRIVKKAFD